MYASKNDSVSFIFRCCIVRPDSLIRRNLFYVGKMFGLKIMDIMRGHLGLLNLKENEDEIRSAEHVRELLRIRDGIMQVDGLSHDDVCELIEFSCIM